MRRGAWTRLDRRTPNPRHEIVPARGGPVAGDAFEDVGEVGLPLDGVHFTGRDHGQDGGGPFAAELRRPTARSARSFATNTVSAKADTNGSRTILSVSLSGLTFTSRPPPAAIAPRRVAASCMRARVAASRFGRRVESCLTGIIIMKIMTLRNFLPWMQNSSVAANWRMTCELSRFRGSC